MPPDMQCQHLAVNSKVPDVHKLADDLNNVTANIYMIHVKKT